MNICPWCRTLYACYYKSLSTPLQNIYYHVHFINEEMRKLSNNIYACPMTHPVSVWVKLLKITHHLGIKFLT